MDWVPRNQGLKLEQISSNLGIVCIHKRLNTWPQMAFFDHGVFILAPWFQLSESFSLQSQVSEDSCTSHWRRCEWVHGDVNCPQTDSAGTAGTEDLREWEESVRWLFQDRTVSPAVAFFWQ